MKNIIIKANTFFSKAVRFLWKQGCRNIAAKKKRSPCKKTFIFHLWGKSHHRYVEFSIFSLYCRPSQIEILYLWTSFFLEDKNAVDYKSRSIFSQSYLKLKVFFLFLFTITTVAHSNFGEVNVKFFTLCRLVFQHPCWWANFISFYVPLYKNFLVISGPCTMTLCSSAFL